MPIRLPPPARSPDRPPPPLLGDYVRVVRAGGSEARPVTAPASGAVVPRHTARARPGQPGPVTAPDKDCDMRRRRCCAATRRSRNPRHAGPERRGFVPVPTGSAPPGPGPPVRHAAGRRRHPGDRYLELEFEPHGSAGGRFQQDAVVNYDRRTHSGREVSAHAAIVLMRGDGLPRGSGRGRLAARTAVDTPSCFITR